MHVRGAAAEIGLEPEDIRIGSVGGPVAILIDAAHHLVHLLVVLVGPHIRFKRGWQRVEGHLLEAVPEALVAENSQQLFVGEHAFDDGAQLGALSRIESSIVLVAGVNAIHLAVMAIEHAERLIDRRAVGFVAGDLPPHGGCLQRHGVVDDVCGEVCLFSVDLAGILEAGEMPLPVEGLFVKHASQLEQFLVSGAVIEPNDAQDFLRPAMRRPPHQRTLFGVLQVVFEVFRHQGDDARVAGGLLVLRKHLQHDHVGPPIGVLPLSGVRAFFGIRTDRTAFALVFEGPVDPLLGFCDQRLIVEKIGQRQQAIEIVRAALPALAAAAEPAAVRAEVRPELVQMAGEPIRLDAELLAEPTPRLDGPQGQSSKSIIGEGLLVPMDFCRRQLNTHGRLIGRRLFSRAGSRDAQDENRDQHHKDCFSAGVYSFISHGISAQIQVDYNCRRQAIIAARPGACSFPSARRHAAMRARP